MAACARLGHAGVFCGRLDLNVPDEITIMRIISTLATVLFLTACGGGDTGDASDNKDTKNGGVIPQHQLDAMDKAKNVEDVLNKADQDRRDQVDSQG